VGVAKLYFAQHALWAQVVRNLENALASGDPEVEKLFLKAFGDVVLDPKYLHGDDAMQQVSHVCLYPCVLHYHQE